MKHIDYFQVKGDDPYQCVNVRDILNRDLTELEVKQFRSFFKSMFLMLMNNNEEHSAKKALRDLINKENGEAQNANEELPFPDRLDKKKFNVLWERFKEAHSDISDHFAGNQHNEFASALFLMKIDSDMMMSILDTMLDHRVTCLSVHDSIIVPWIHVDLAKNIITEAFDNMLVHLGVPNATSKTKTKLFFNKDFTRHAKESFVNDADLQKRSHLKRPSFINYIPVATQPI